MLPVCMIMVLWHKPWYILVKKNSVVLNLLKAPQDISDNSALTKEWNGRNGNINNNYK